LERLADEKKAAHRVSMSRFTYCNSEFSYHGYCEKVLRHHQLFVFILIISVKLKNLLLKEQVHFDIFLKYQYGH